MSHIFNIPCRDNAKLKHVINEVKKDKRLWTFWKCSNVVSIDRMGYTDHGPTHLKIVANLALRLIRILVEKKVVPSIVKNYNMKNEDAEVVVVLGAILHDLGIVVIRDGHELYSAFLALEFIEKYLKAIYSEASCELQMHLIWRREERESPSKLEKWISTLCLRYQSKKSRSKKVKKNQSL